MLSKKEDRRITKTRISIKNAFIELLQKNPQKEPSVQDITTQANINRSTFYAHYADTFALREELEDELINEIKITFEGSPQKETTEENIQNLWVYKFFNFMKDNQQMCNILFMENCNSRFTAKLTQALHQEVMKTIPESAKQHHVINANEYLSTFIAYGLVGIMLKWVQEGGIQSAEEIIEMYLSLTPHNQ